MNCLLIIDMQKGFICKNDKLVYKIESLIEQKQFDHIVYSKFINTKNSIFEKQLSWFKLQSEKEQSIVLDTKNNMIIKKYAYSAFTKELINFINENNIETIYICGLDTDACILKTALDIFEFGITPKVLKDYCKSSGGKKYHTSAIKILFRNIGKDNII